MLRTAAHTAHNITHTQAVKTRTILQPLTPYEVYMEQCKSLKFGPDLKENMIEFHNGFGVTAHKWSVKLAELSEQHEQSIFNQPARQAAEAYIVVNAFYSTIRCLENYNFWQRGVPLINCIVPIHEKKVLNEYRKRYDEFSDHEKFTLGTALAPGVLKKAGLECDKKILAQIDHYQESLPKEVLFLDYAEFFSFLDYTSSESGTFNAINGAARAKAQYNQPLCQEIISELSDTFIRAWIKLSNHPLFSVKDIVIYKGLSFSNPAGKFFKLYLGDRFANKSLVYFPHVISGTSDPSLNYARVKCPVTYDVTATFKDDNAVDAELFQNPNSRGMKEVIAGFGDYTLESISDSSDGPLSYEFKRNL